MRLISPEARPALTNKGISDRGLQSSADDQAAFSHALGAGIKSNEHGAYVSHHMGEE
ncbi:MAG: hypothetical protein RR387_04525 [Clostridiales bacterium]